jgi:hypothetical protein
MKGVGSRNRFYERIGDSVRSCTLAFTVENSNVVIGQSGKFHIILRPQPHPNLPSTQVHVPEGGSGWAFVLAAFAVIGWAAIKRYGHKSVGQQAA